MFTHTPLYPKTNKCTSFDSATQTIVQIINNGIHRKYYLCLLKVRIMNHSFCQTNSNQPYAIILYSQLNTENQ